MELIKSDECYIIREPKKAFLAIVEMDNYIFPLLRETNQVIETLKEAGFDLFFSFYEGDCKENKINPSKFTAVEEGVGFIYMSAISSAQSFFNVARFISETVKNYVGVTYVRLGGATTKLKPEEIKSTGEKFIGYAPSFTMPVLEINRRSADELYTSYMSEEVTQDKEEEKGIFGLLQVGKEKGFELLGDGCWETHTSPTQLPYFPISFIPSLKEKMSDEWWESWTENDKPMNLVSSAIKEFRVEFLDRSPEKLDLCSPTKPIENNETLVEEKKEEITKRKGRKKTNSEGV